MQATMQRLNLSGRQQPNLFLSLLQSLFFLIRQLICEMNVLCVV